MSKVAITPENFVNEWHQARVRLLQAENWLSGEIKKFLAPFGITQKQFNILRILRGHKEELLLSILDIRNRMIDKMSDTSRIIDRLAKKELIQKIPCTMDKRASRIKITPKGLKILEKIDHSMLVLDKAMSNLSSTEAQELSRLLKKMVG